MTETIARKCNECKQDIIIERNNIDNAVLYSGKYYHTECFCQYCERKAAETTRSHSYWQKILDNIEVYKKEAVEKSNYRFAKDDLNKWLLAHYDIEETTKRFWTVVADIENGKRNGRQCKPIPVTLLFNAWRWSQRNLDSINRKNKQNHRGPKDDDARINYDLAIVMKHIPDYLKAKAKHDAEEAERVAREKARVKINYNNIDINPFKAEGLDDISDLLDDF